MGQKSVDHNGVEADDEEKRKKVSKDEETHLKPRYICDMILRGPSFISKLPIFFRVEAHIHSLTYKDPIKVSLLI